MKTYPDPTQAMQPAGSDIWGDSAYKPPAMSYAGETRPSPLPYEVAQEKERINDDVLDAEAFPTPQPGRFFGMPEIRVDESVPPGAILYVGRDEYGKPKIVGAIYNLCRECGKFGCELGAGHPSDHFAKSINYPGRYVVLDDTGWVLRVV
jgi:hypothetical protein